MKNLTYGPWGVFCMRYVHWFHPSLVLTREHWQQELKMVASREYQTNFLQSYILQ